MSKDSILSFGNKYEDKGHRVLLHVAVRLINGFFHFKKKKGDLVAGCATFFSILSFCPVMLLVVTLAGKIIGDVELAKVTVMEGMKANFPTAAPWILESIEKIINGQLHTTAGMNMMNLALLLYSSLGVIAAMVFGMDTISSSESRGGFVIEDFKALLLGAFGYFFIIALIVTSNPKILSMVMGQKMFFGRDALLYMAKNNILPIGLSMMFFTIFYKWAPSRSVSWKDSAWGASAFVGCFIFAKSFYWVYMKYAQEDIAHNFGNFYSMIVAVVWVYFLLSAFFYGASVAYMNSPVKIVDEVPVEGSGPDQQNAA